MLRYMLVPVMCFISVWFQRKSRVILLQGGFKKYSKPKLHFMFQTVSFYIQYTCWVSQLLATNWVFFIIYSQSTNELSSGRVLDRENFLNLAKSSTKSSRRKNEDERDNFATIGNQDTHQTGVCSPFLIYLPFRWVVTVGLLGSSKRAIFQPFSTITLKLWTQISFRFSECLDAPVFSFFQFQEVDAHHQLTRIFRTI